MSRPRGYACRLCEAAFPAAYQTQAGAGRDGFEKIVLHWQYEHADAFREALQGLLLNDKREEGNDGKGDNGGERQEA